MSTQKVRADQICHKLEQLHRGDAFFTQVKNGPTFTSNNLLILDAVAIKKSWTKPCITGYEIKVDRGDFTRDEKWVHYLKYCHKFYFACPVGLIDPEELPKEIGLIYYNPEKDCLFTKRKAIPKVIELPTEMFYYIIMSQIEPERHPFFSSRREFFEAFVRDKTERKNLGYEVRFKLNEYIREMERKAKEAERLAERYEQDSKELECLKQTLRSCGVNTLSWRWKEDLEKTLKSGVPLGIDRQIENAISSLQSVLEKLKREKVSA